VLWFYVKNNAIAPLPDFTGCLIEEAMPVWEWRPPEKEKKRLRDLLDAITLLKCHSLCRTGVIGAYHARRVAVDGAHPPTVRDGARHMA
jgi:hypothetical protein